MQTINWDEVSEEQNVYDVLPEGDYTLTVEQCEEKQNKNGKDYWAFKFSVDGEEKAKVWHNLYFTEKTLNQCKHFLKALGLNVTGTNHIIPLDTIGKNFKGSLSITEYEYNGQTRQKNELDIWSVEQVKVKTSSKPRKDIIDKDEIPF